MQRVPVQSSNLASVGYDAVSQVLEVQFRDGGVYQYIHVPPSIHAGLMNAGSKGRYFHRFIMPRYRYRRISR